MIGTEWQHKEKYFPWLVFASGLVVFLSNVDLLSSGDTIYYANIIDTFRFDKLTGHQGYYVIGLVVSTVINAFAIVPTDQALAYTSVIFGSAALAVGFLLAKHYLESTNYALIVVLILMICHRFFENSIWAEIYIVQAFFIWASILLFEKQRFYCSGLALAFAFWVTPLTLPFCLWFPVSAYLKRTGILSLLKTALPVFALYGLFLVFFYEELLWGNRGLLTQDQNREILLGAGLRDFAAYQFKHYTFLNLLLIPALFVIRDYRYLFWSSIAFALPNIYVISQLRAEQNVFILPLDIIFAVWMTIGFRYLLAHRLRIVAISLLILHGAIFVAADSLFVRPANANYPNEMRKIGQIVDSDAKSLLFVDWSRRMAFVYFNRAEPSDPLEAGYWYNKSYTANLGNLQQNDAKSADFAEYTPIYVLESWSVSGYGKLFLSESVIQERTDRFSRRRRIERLLNVPCLPVFEGIYVLYECGQTGN